MHSHLDYVVFFLRWAAGVGLGQINRGGAVSAQESIPLHSGAPKFTNRTASGTYGYRMSGVIIGVGPVLVNGLFTHNHNGTMSGNVHLTIANQQIPNAGWTEGKFETNNDCTGSGEFFIAALNQKITYNFIATDGGRQIELLNTNEGNAFHGVGRRIGKSGRARSCTNGTILGSYGYRLDGSIPGVPNLVLAGTITHALDDGSNGVMTNRPHVETKTSIWKAGGSTNGCGSSSSAPSGNGRRSSMMRGRIMARPATPRMSGRTPHGPIGRSSR
jgi:hypothetical protein